MRFYWLILSIALVAGCAGTQPPAPVVGGDASAGQGAVPPADREMPEDVLTTEALPPPPATTSREPIEYQPNAPAVIEAPPPPETEKPFAQETPPAPVSPATSPAPESAPTQVNPERELTPEPEPPLTPFEPFEAVASLSPAVGALVVAANQNTSTGKLDAASATLERAIRIEPRNANLFYKLALIRLKQSKPRLAEDLAKKSALLAASDRALKKHSWLLIAHARELQHNFKGAKEARLKADSF
jgi:tetratricopeptide (TPR) repeat protein